MTDTAKYNDEDLVDHNGVAAIIKDSSKNVLVQEHVKYGFWTIPVGKVALGRPVVDGLKEELFEECGITVDGCEELLTREFVYDRKGRTVHLTAYLFEITSYSGIVENKEAHKHSQQKFLSIEEILQLPYLSDMTLLYLEFLGYHREARL